MNGRIRLIQMFRTFSIFILLTSLTPFAKAQQNLSISLSCSPSHIPAGSTTTCTAAVNFTGSVVDFVVDNDWNNDYNSDSVSIVVANGQAIVTGYLGDLAPGVHYLTAQDDDDPNVTTTISVVIDSPGSGSGPVTPPFYISCISGTVIQTAICTATLPEFATGQVSFKLDGSPWGVGTVVSGLSTITAGLNGVPAGTHQIIANYSGDAGYLPATETAQLVTSSDSQSPIAFGEALYSYLIPTAGFDGAGNVVGYTDSVNGTWTASYDNLNRLSTATYQVGTAQMQYMCWKYDSFGNRLGQESSNSMCDPSSIPALSSAPSNQISAPGYSYYPDGGLHTDGTNIYLYDGEGRLCAVQRNIVGPASIEGYLYDAEGNRIAKGTLSALSCDLNINNFTTTETMWIGPEGATDSVSSITSETSNIYAEGQLIATYDSSQVYHFHYTDWLGTRRIQTDSSGNIETSFLNRPFGDSDQLSTDPTDASNIHFTGHEHDSGSGLDYFGARYYLSSIGRFLSPDPTLLVFADPNNPQSMNLYAYVQNNPLGSVDPDGTHIRCVDTTMTIVGADDETGQAPTQICWDEPDLAPHNDPDQGDISATSSRPAAQRSLPPDPISVRLANGWSAVMDNKYVAKSLSTTGTFSAGAGDFLSFGLTKRFNDWTGGSAFINYNSGVYKGGKGVGIGLTVVDIVATGFTVAAVRGGKSALAPTAGVLGKSFGRGGKIAGSGFRFNQGVVRFGWYWDKARQLDAVGLRVFEDTKLAKNAIHFPFWFPGKLPFTVF